MKTLFHILILSFLVQSPELFARQSIDKEKPIVRTNPTEDPAKKRERLTNEVQAFKTRYNGAKNQIPLLEAELERLSGNTSVLESGGVVTTT